MADPAKATSTQRDSGRAPTTAGASSSDESRSSDSRVQLRGLDYAAQSERLAPGNQPGFDAAAVQLSPAAEPALAAALHRGRDGGAASGPPVQRKLVFKKTELGKDDLRKAINIMTSLGKGHGLDLPFGSYGEQVEKLLADDKASFDLDAAKDDAKVIVDAFNHVAGTKYVVGDAPKLVVVEKKQPIKEVKGEDDNGEKGKKDEEKPSIPGLIEKGWVFAGKDKKSFSYYWGGTTKVEEALKAIFGPDNVKKKETESGLRELHVADGYLFAEEVAPFPAEKRTEMTKEDGENIDFLVKEFALGKASHDVVENLYRMKLAKKMTSRQIRKELNNLLTRVREVTPKESTVDAELEKIAAKGLFASLAEGVIPKGVVEGLGQGVPTIPNDPECAKAADFLANKTDILKSSAWLSHRTDSEFYGTVGEYLARLEYDRVMPEREKLGDGDEKLIKLHSVHMRGKLYRKGPLEKDDWQLYRDGTDVCPELDLLSVVKGKDGYRVSALGNVKVTTDSAQSAASKQNNLAEECLASHAEKREAKVDDKTKGVVEKVFGHDVETNKPLELTGLLVPGKAQPKKATIGAKDKKDTHGYDSGLTLTYSQITTIALLLREKSAKMDKK